MKVTTQPRGTSRILYVVEIETRCGLRLKIREYSNKGVIATVHNSLGVETHRFLVEARLPDIILREPGTRRTLTLEVTK